MGLFNNGQAEQNIPVRQALETKYTNARRDILFVLGFTIINIVLLVANANNYFLFSAYIPYVIVDLAMFFCGKYPVEYYEGFPAEAFFGDGVFAVMLALAAVILVMYLLSWFFSDKGRVGWLIFALVLFGLDSAGMLLLGGISADNIFDIVFHAWFLVSLFRGVFAHYKLKKLPAEEELPAQEEPEPTAPVEE